MKNSYIFTENIGEKEINEVTVTSQKGFWFSYGVIIPKTEKGYIGSYKYPYNDKYTVEWIDSNAKYFSKSIDLRLSLPKSFSKNAKLIFRIDKNNELSFEFINPPQ